MELKVSDRIVFPAHVRTALSHDTLRFVDTPAHIEDTWGYDGWDTCFKGISYDTCPNDVPGVDPGKDPLLNLVSGDHFALSCFRFPIVSHAYSPSTIDELRRVR